MADATFASDPAPAQSGPTLTDEQERALAAILDWYADPKRQEFYLAGYAGVGKSFLVDTALRRLREKYRVKNVPTAAFTGKAANVLRKRGVEAQTIHSLIYILDDQDDEDGPTFRLNEWGPARDADLIVLDECSMIDERMADDLRSFGKKLLVIGDPGQLPPVRGQGAFTNRPPDAMLTEIKRQAADNPIIDLATRARKGQPLPLGNYGQGVRVVPYDANAGAYVYDAETQVICGVHRVRWTLTRRIRNWLGYTSRRPEPGETVLCRRNNHQRGIFNGQFGEMRSLSPLPGKDKPLHLATVLMEEQQEPLTLNVHPYLFDEHYHGRQERPERRRRTEVNHFDFGHVLTCHSAQGSQFPRVTVIDDSRAFREDAAKWLYTAITRAESGLTIVTREDA